MKQGGSEANDNYLERFKANVGVVELAQVRNVFCSREIIQNPTPTSNDINIEEDCFKAILLLKNADDKRYGDLRDRLRESSMPGR